MTDTRNLGLGELGQRVQAMGDPVIDSRLRPYQGTTSANNRPDSSLESLSSIPAAPAAVPPSQRSISQPTIKSQASQPATPLPYSASKAESVSVWETVPQPPASASSATPPPPAGLHASATPAATPADPNAPKTGLHRALDAIRSTLPLMQKLLPIIDGNFATAVSALIASRPHPAPPPAPLLAPVPQVVQVDLEPIERGLVEVRNSHRELRGQVQEQVTTLKRVEDQLDRVREATDRNTLEQQELVEDLRSVGNRLGRFAIIGLVFLVVSLGLNIYLIFQLQHILR